MNRFQAMTDDELAISAQNSIETGSDDSFQNQALDYLLNKYKNLVKSKANAHYLQWGDRDDLIQEGMIGLYKAVLSYCPDKNFSFGAFADLCVTRQIISAVKKTSRKKHQALDAYISFDNGDQYVDNTPNPEDLVISDEKRLSIERAMANCLSKHEHLVLTLYMEGKTYKEIAEFVSISEKSVDNALHRARVKMRDERI